MAAGQVMLVPATGRIATVLVAMPGAAGSITVMVAFSESMIVTVIIPPPTIAAISSSCNGK